MEVNLTRKAWCTVRQCVQRHSGRGVVWLRIRATSRHTYGGANVDISSRDRKHRHNTEQKEVRAARLRIERIEPLSRRKMPGCSRRFAPTRCSFPRRCWDSTFPSLLLHPRLSSIFFIYFIFFSENPPIPIYLSFRSWKPRYSDKINWKKSHHFDHTQTSWGNWNCIKL